MRNILLLCNQRQRCIAHAQVTSILTCSHELFTKKKRCSITCFEVHPLYISRSFSGNGAESPPVFTLSVCCGQGYLTRNKNHGLNQVYVACLLNFHGPSRGRLVLSGCDRCWHQLHKSRHGHSSPPYQLCPLHKVQILTLLAVRCRLWRQPGPSSVHSDSCQSCGPVGHQTKRSHISFEERYRGKLV